MDLCKLATESFLVLFSWLWQTIHFGCQGRISDEGVFRNCDFYRALVCNKLNLSLRTEVPSLNPGWNSTEPLPLVFVGDDAFPRTNFCMKPYPLTALTD